MLGRKMVVPGDTTLDKKIIPCYHETQVLGKGEKWYTFNKITLDTISVMKKVTWGVRATGKATVENTVNETISVGQTLELRNNPKEGAGQAKG